MDVSAFFAPPEILGAKRALCIQPHADDNEIGMGGTIAALAARGCEIHYPVSYTHLRAHETLANLVCRLLLEKIFFNDTATTEIYTLHIVGSVRCV